MRRKNSAGFIYGVFDLGDKPKEDVPADVIECVIASEPVLGEQIENGQAKIHFDYEIRGIDSVHRFDAAISSRRKIILIKHYRDSQETQVEDLAQLHDDLLDISAEIGLKQIQIIVIGNDFASGGAEFMNDVDNWNSKKCEISRILVQLSEDGYRVVASSDENERFIVPSNTKQFVETKSSFLSIRFNQQPAMKRAIISAAIVIIVVIAAFSYIIISQSNDGPGGGGLIEIIPSLKNNISGNWTLLINGILGLPKVNYTWIIVRNVSSDLNESQLTLQPMKLGHLTSGVYYQGIRFFHSADPDFYQDYPSIDRTKVHAWDYLSVGDFFTFNKTLYHIQSEDRLIGYHQVYNNVNGTWDTQPIYITYKEQVTLWYSWSNTDDPNVALSGGIEILRY